MSLPTPWSLSYREREKESESVRERESWEMNSGLTPKFLSLSCVLPPVPVLEDKLQLKFLQTHGPDGLDQADGRISVGRSNLGCPCG